MMYEKAYNKAEELLQVLGIPLYFQEADDRPEIYAIWDLIAENEGSLGDDDVYLMPKLSVTIWHKNIKEGIKKYDALSRHMRDNDVYLNSSISHPVTDGYRGKNFIFIMEVF